MSAGFIQLATNEFFVNEASGEVVVTLVRVDGSEGEATVIYSTINGTATNGAAPHAGNATTHVRRSEPCADSFPMGRRPGHVCRECCVAWPGTPE